MRRLLLVLLFLSLTAAGLYSWSQRHPGTPKRLHPCQPPPEKVRALAADGQEVKDAKCDDKGGMYLLVGPKR